MTGSRKGTKVVCCVCDKVVSAWRTLDQRGWHVASHHDDSTGQRCWGYSQTFGHKLYEPEVEQ